MPASSDSESDHEGPGDFNDRLAALRAVEHHGRGDEIQPAKGMAEVEVSDSDSEDFLLLEKRLRRLRGEHEEHEEHEHEEEISEHQNGEPLNSGIRTNPMENDSDSSDVGVIVNETLKKRKKRRKRVSKDSRDVMSTDEAPESESGTNSDPGATVIESGQRETEENEVKVADTEQVRPPYRKKRSMLKKRASWRENPEPYTWDPVSHSPNMIVLNAEPHIIRRGVAKQSTDGARGVHGVRTGCCTFKFEFNDKPWGSHCAIGLCTKRATLHCQGYGHLLGQSTESWGWDIPSRTLLHRGQSLGQYSQGVTDMPRTLYMSVDMDKGTAALSLRNMDNFSVVFTGLKPKDHKLYPAVSLVYGGGEVSISVVSLGSETAMPSTSTSVDCSPKHHQYDTASTTVGDTYTDESRTQSRMVERQTEDEEHRENATLDVTSAVVPLSGTAPNDLAATGESGKELEESDHVDEAALVKEQNEGGTPVTHEEINEGVASPVPQQEEEKPWINELRARYSSFNSGAENDSEESDTEVEYMQVSELSEADQTLLQSAHGWDSTNKGAGVQVYPNTPNLCVPSVKFGDKVQAVKTRRGLKKGHHRWLIRERKFYSPLVSDEDMESTRNNLIIGAVDNEHRTFNYGFSISQLGRHAWGFNLCTKTMWHLADKQRLQPNEDGLFKTEEDLDTIDLDLTKGIEVTLDTKAHTLTLTYQGQVVCEFGGVRGKAIFPFILFQNLAYFPVEMQYIEGPKADIEATLKWASSLPHFQQEDFCNYRPLAWRPAHTHGSVTVADNDRIDYGWGVYSWGIALQDANTIYLGQPPPDVFAQHDVAIAAKPISGSRHRIRFSIRNPQQFVLGLVSMDFDQNLLTNGHVRSHKVTPSILGCGIHSWAWDLRTLCLYHSGMRLGRYPVYKDFDPALVQQFAMILDFNQYSSNTMSFSAVLADGTTKELGMAFLNLPASVWPAVAIVNGSHEGQLAMNYVAGPEEFVNDVKASRVCNIL